MRRIIAAVAALALPSLAWAQLSPQMGAPTFTNPGQTRLNLGLGTIATQSAAAVAIAGGTIAGTPISGSTGAFSTLSASGATTLAADLTTSGRIVSSAGLLRFVNNGTNAIAFQNAAGGNTFLINGSASAIANQVTMVPQVAGNGPSISATGTDTNIDLKLASKGTGKVTVNLSPFAVTPSPLVAVSGTTPPNQFTFSTSASGTWDTTVDAQMVQFVVGSDTMTKGNSTIGFYPAVAVIKNWGGGSRQGNQQAFRVNMVQTGAVSGYTPPSNVQMVGAGLFADYSFNLGGTSTTIGSTIGAAYAAAATTYLHAGATNYTLASLIEWDLQVEATAQPLTIGGTITAGDTITLTYTSASIVGSPVSVVATTGTGDVLRSLANKLVGAVNNNAALANAGVSSEVDTTTGAVKLYWQGHNATTVSVAVGGAATETAVLGSVVLGASTNARINNSFASRGAGRAAGMDAILNFGTLGATHGGSAMTLLNLGQGGGVFPIAPGGALLTVVLQNGSSNLGAVQPSWSPQLARGFDLRLLNFTQYSGSPFLSPGFNIDGAGALNLQNAVISVTAAALTLDVPSGRIGTGAPAIVSGGGGGAGVTTNNYYVGDIVQGVNGADTNAGQYLVTSVNASTGAVTGLITLVQPSTMTTSLGTAIATIGGSGTGLTITPTPATNNAISLAPTGGLTTVGGGLTVTGTIAGPTTTQAVDTNTTALASTAFVLGQASAALPLIDGTAAVGTSTRWSREDHKHPTDTTRAALSGANFTGAVTVGNNTTQQQLSLNGPAAVNRNLVWQTAGVKRLQITVNNTAEGGSNAGSDVQAFVWDDPGTTSITAFSITRSTGAMTIGNINVTGGVLNGAVIGNGTPANGTFTNATATSFRVGSNQVTGARQTGWTAMTGTPDLASTFATSSVTLAQLAGRVMSLQAALTTHGLIGP